MTILNLINRFTHVDTARSMRFVLLSGVVAASISAGCSLELQAIRYADRMTPASRIPLSKPAFEDPSDVNDLISTVRREASRIQADQAQPWEWNRAATSAGGRAIETVNIGDGDFRTLVLGSVGGDDAKAIEVVEMLAEHLQSRRLILEGINTTIVRTLNPDGRVANSFLNKAGVYINHDFPVALRPELRASAKPAKSGTQPETNFLLSVLRQNNPPRRVIHVRSIDSDTGRIGASTNVSRLADEAADWMIYDRMTFPTHAAEGTLERMMSNDPQFEVMTVAIPQDQSASESWQQCRDALVSLLVPDETQSGGHNRQRPPAPVATSENDEVNRFRRRALRAPHPPSNTNESGVDADEAPEMFKND